MNKVHRWGADGSGYVSQPRSISPAEDGPSKRYLVLWNYVGFRVLPCLQSISFTEHCTWLISLLLGPNRKIFRPPPDTPDAKWDVAVLQRHDLFFGPCPSDFAARMGDDGKQLLLAITVLTQERQPFRNWDPNKIAPADVDFLCKLIQLDPEKRPPTKKSFEGQNGFRAGKITNRINLRLRVFVGPP